MSKPFIFNKISVHFTWLFILLLAITFSGCRILYRSILGVDITPKWYMPKDIEKSFHKYNIPTNQSYVLDTVSFSEAIRSKYKADVGLFKDTASGVDSTSFYEIKSCAKEDRQMVQFRFFNKEGKPLMKLVNCDLDPPIPMSWNIDSCFNFFPPRPIQENKNEEDLHLSFFLPHIKSLAGDSLTVASLPQADYYAMVIWNDIMIKPSRKLIKEIKAYNIRYANKNIYVLYVNNHSQILWPALSDEGQKQVLNEIIKP